MSGGGAGGVLEDARRALRKGGAGAAAGKVPGKAPRDGAVDDRGRGGFGEQGEAATDMFDRLYRSEIARRKAERMADAGSSAPVRRFGPGTVPGGSITSIPPGLGLDEIQALVCSAGEGGDVVFRGGGNHSWRWDLEVCEEGLVGWQYDDLCERYMDEGQAWEWARQEERAPIVPMRMVMLLPMTIPPLASPFPNSPFGSPPVLTCYPSPLLFPPLLSPSPPLPRGTFLRLAVVAIVSWWL